MSVTRGKTRITIKFPFAPVVLNDSNSLFGVSFFLIYLDLKMTYEKILLNNSCYCT